MVFPTFFNFSLNLAIRSSWSEPQSPLVLFLLTVYSFSVFGCKEYNQSDFGVDHWRVNMSQMLFFIILMTQWSQYLYTTIVWSAKWPLWLAPGCLAQKYLWSLVFPALNRTSYRSAEESSLGFCLQVSWVAQIRLDFPQICKPIFLQSLQRKEKKKRKSVKGAVWAG